MTVWVCLCGEITNRSGYLLSGNSLGLFTVCDVSFEFVLSGVELLGCAD